MLAAYMLRLVAVFIVVILTFCELLDTQQRMQQLPPKLRRSKSTTIMLSVFCTKDCNTTDTYAGLAPELMWSNAENDM